MAWEQQLAHEKTILESMEGRRATLFQLASMTEDATSKKEQAEHKKTISDIVDADREIKDQRKKVALARGVLKHCDLD